MDIQLVKKLYEWANSMSIKPDLGQRVFHLQGINEIKNGIIKLSERRGDDALMVILELVEE